MLSVPSLKPSTTDITALHSSSVLNTPSQNASLAHEAEDPLPQHLPKAPTRHYTTLQEHADQVFETDTLGQAEGAYPRHSGRREGFSLGQQPEVENRRHNQYAMTADVKRSSSPPPLEEIIRRAHIDDADDIQNKIRHVDSMESHPPTALRLSESISSIESDYSPPDNRKSSLVAFAKGFGRQRRDSKQDHILKLQKKDSSLSVTSPPFLDARNSHEQLSNPAVAVDEPSKADERIVRLSNSQTPSASSGLRARRKVQLDLSIPTKLPDLPARSRYPVETVGNITTPRPRSPKTPWMPSEQARWELDRIGKSPPIKEEDYISDDIATLDNVLRNGDGLLPGNDTLDSSQSPNFDRRQEKMGDCWHITHSLPKRSRSGYSHHSAASASGLGGAQTSDRAPRLVEERMQGHAAADLQQVVQDAKKFRSRRWRWRFTTSSEDATPSSGSEPSKRRLSFNPFKRSSRLSDQTIPGTFLQNTKSNHPTDHSRQNQHSTPSLTHIPAPPTFTPPGLKRVPTPPLYDANGEVKGKLADFFFDLHSNDITGNRKKPPSSLEGYWDSDALLMSLSSDLTHFGEEEDEEEGPEGPLRNTIQTRPTFATIGSSKPFAKRIQGFQGIKPPLIPSLFETSPMLGHDGWYRVNHEQGANLRDSRTIAELARQEEEERRKFEWLVPEHLPNSILCPLHEKYTGPSKGLCYWHGRRSGAEIRRGEYTRPEVWSGSGERGDYISFESGNGEGDVEVNVGRSPGIVTPLAKEVKKRRLVSLSSP